MILTWPETPEQLTRGQEQDLNTGARLAAGQHQSGGSFSSSSLWMRQREPLPSSKSSLHPPQYKPIVWGIGCPKSKGLLGTGQGAPTEALSGRILNVPFFLRIVNCILGDKSGLFGGFLLLNTVLYQMGKLGISD